MYKTHYARQFSFLFRFLLDVVRITLFSPIKFGSFGRNNIEIDASLSILLNLTRSFNTDHQEWI